MNKTIYNMSKDELIKNIAETDRIGKELSESLKSLSNELERKKVILIEEALEDDYELMYRGCSRLKALAMAKAEMMFVLNNKFGIFIM